MSDERDRPIYTVRAKLGGYQLGEAVLSETTLSKFKRVDIAEDGTRITNTLGKWLKHRFKGPIVRPIFNGD